jgi:hypothetical protein
MIRTTPRPRKNGGLSTGVTVRESTAIANRRSIVIIIGPGALIGFRLKGTRRVEETTVEACYAMAVKQRVAAEKEAKLAAKRPAGVSAKVWRGRRL